MEKKFLQAELDGAKCMTRSTSSSISSLASSGGASKRKQRNPMRCVRDDEGAGHVKRVLMEESWKARPDNETEIPRRARLPLHFQIVCFQFVLNAGLLRGSGRYTSCECSY